MPNKPAQKIKTQQAKAFKGIIVGSLEWKKNLSVKQAIIEARKETINPLDFVNILHQKQIPPNKAIEIIYKILIEKHTHKYKKQLKQRAEELVQKRYGLK
jgi:hypothetical protein